jgi:hypothetical protein
MCLIGDKSATKLHPASQEISTELHLISQTQMVGGGCILPRNYTTRELAPECPEPHNFNAFMVATRELFIDMLVALR